MDMKIPVPAGLILAREIRPRVKKVKKKKSASKRGKSARVKGHSFEREVAGIFREIGYPQACRQLEYQQGLGVDLANTGIYQVQCKRTKTYTSLKDIEEIPAKDGHVPLLIAKADRSDILVCMPIGHFVDLIRNRRSSNVLEC